MKWYSRNNFGKSLNVLTGDSMLITELVWSWVLIMPNVAVVNALNCLSEFGLYCCL